MTASKELTDYSHSFQLQLQKITELIENISEKIKKFNYTISVDLKLNPDICELILSFRKKRVELTDSLLKFEELYLKFPEENSLKNALPKVKNFLEAIEFIAPDIDYDLKTRNFKEFSITIKDLMQEFDEFQKIIVDAVDLREFSLSENPKIDLFKNDYPAYKEVSKVIASSSDSAILENIQNIIDDISKPIRRNIELNSGTVSFEGVPFIAVVGPSFMGKSQLAFTLSASQPVIYLNPTSGQNVYCSFLPISRKMYSLLSEDLLKLPLGQDTEFVDVELLLQDAGLKNRQIPFKSLGFLFALIEKAILFDGFDSDNSEKYWFDEYTEISYLKYSDLSIVEFIAKFSKLLQEKRENLRKNNETLSNSELMKKIKLPIVFIDEFSKAKELAFLRSLVRSILLPCILASTNAKITSMISAFKGDGSRQNRSKLCYLISLLPATVISGVLKSITIPEIKNNEGVAKEKSLEDLIEITPDSVDLTHLFDAFGITVSDAHKVFFSDFMKLIISQSSTCLQGISSLSLKAMISVIEKYDPAINEHPFRNIIAGITEDLIEKNYEIALENDLLFYSIYSFSPCSQLYDIKEYAEGVASNAINNHYYFLGEKAAIRSGIRSKGITELEKIGKELIAYNGLFMIKSYFSNFKDDIILHISIWNIFHRESRNDYTIASIIKKMYDNTSDYYLNVEALSSNHLAQEFLTCFAMASASHGCFPDMTDGLILFKRFATQIQISHGTLALFTVPKALESFLRNLKIPYLIPQMPVDQSPLEPIKKIMQLGVCKRLRNKKGFNISFSIFGSLEEEVQEEGVVEYINVDTPITRRIIRKHMIRAMNKSRKLTIFLANKIDSSLKSKNEFNKFNPTISKAEKEERMKAKAAKAADEKETVGLVATETTVKKAKLIKETYEESMNRAFLDKDLKTNSFNLNIYSLFFNSEARELSDLKFETLHESNNPSGVFIIVESNCDLSPKPASIFVEVVKEEGVEDLEAEELNFTESEDEDDEISS